MLLPVKDILLSANFAINLSIDTEKPPLPTKEPDYSKTKSIGMRKIISDIAHSRLLTLETHDAATLANAYNQVFPEIVDAHAPIKKKVISIYPSAHWYADEISSEKRECKI